MAPPPYHRYGDAVHRRLRRWICFFSPLCAFQVNDAFQGDIRHERTVYAHHRMFGYGRLSESLQALLGRACAQQSSDGRRSEICRRAIPPVCGYSARAATSDIYSIHIAGGEWRSPYHAKPGWPSLDSMHMRSIPKKGALQDTPHLNAHGS